MKHEISVESTLRQAKTNTYQSLGLGKFLISFRAWLTKPKDNIYLNNSEGFHRTQS